MIIGFQKQQLGSGIYTVPDISRLLGLPQAKVRRYLNLYWDEKLGKKLFNQTYSWSAGNKIKAVNFYTLIELFTCFHLQDLGVSVRQVLKSRMSIAKELQTPYPFASARLLSDGRKIWYEFKDALVNADGSRQTDFVDFIKKFAGKIDFDAGKIAQKFWPAGKTSDVIINPHNQFGQPVLNGTNVSAQVVFSMYESGERPETIAILYDLTRKQVEDAISFFKKSAA
jgi:uncharacterized protein (DUF433 family)